MLRSGYVLPSNLPHSRAGGRNCRAASTLAPKALATLAIASYVPTSIQGAGSEFTGLFLGFSRHGKGNRNAATYRSVNSSSCVSPDFYEQRAQQHQHLSDQLARRSLYVSNFRGLTFVIFAVATGFTIFGHAGRLGLVLSLLGIISFIVLVVRHARIIDAQEREERWVRVNLDAAKRVKPGAWYELPQTGEQFCDAQHPYADDLDIFGVGSLFQRICVAQTQIGYRRLCEWLSGETQAPDFEHRQKAVRALAPRLEFRQELEVLGLGTRDTSLKGKAMGEPSDLAPFLAWAAGYSQQGKHRRFVVVAWAFPALSLACALVSYRGLIPISVAIVPLAFHLLALVRARPHMQSLIRMLSTAERMVEQGEPPVRIVGTQLRFALVAAAATGRQCTA